MCLFVSHFFFVAAEDLLEGKTRQDSIVKSESTGGNNDMTDQEEGGKSG